MMIRIDALRDAVIFLLESETHIGEDCGSDFEQMADECLRGQDSYDGEGCWSGNCKHWNLCKYRYDRAKTARTLLEKLDNIDKKV